MAPSPQTVTTKPLFLNANTGVHKADDLRKITDDVYAVGVEDLNSFKVRQRVAGAAMSVDVTDAATISRAYVRGPNNDQGTYRVDNVDENVISAIVNVDIAAADAVNPRIDQVYLAVEDAQYAGTNNLATVRVVTGTPTGGATLDNRTGVGAAPAGMGSILLADVLVPALSVTVVTANIRDRRPIANIGAGPWLGSTGTQYDAVTFVPHSGNTFHAAASAQQASNDNQQSAAAFFLPRRIVGATRLRWKYTQSATPSATNYVLFIADASGRVIASTAAAAFTGGASTAQEANLALLATTTFEAGWYYCGIGLAAMTAASTVLFCGVAMQGTGSQIGPGARNIGFRSAAGGTTVPTTILAFTDMVNSTLTCPSAPTMTLSVT